MKVGHMITADHIAAGEDHRGVDNERVAMFRLVMATGWCECSPSAEHAIVEATKALQTSAGGATANPGYTVFGPIIGSGGVGVSGGTVTIANLVSGAVNTLTLPATAIDVGGGFAGLPCL